MFSEFVYEKLIDKFYIVNFKPHVIEHAQIETKWQI